VPDRGFLLSSSLSVKFTTVIASSALALGAAAAAAASSGAPARAAAPARPAAAHLTTHRPAAGHAQPSIKLATMLAPGTATASTATAASAATSAATPRQIARQMLGSFGWSQRQFPYLNWLWNAESGWNKYAQNPYSGAYGIPQALPGAKMASAGPDWPSNARTQIRWGLRYIRATYGSPRLAWDHEVAYGWY
jgi:hypothetical protein